MIFLSCIPKISPLFLTSKMLSSITQVNRYGTCDYEVLNSQCVIFSADHCIFLLAVAFLSLIFLFRLTHFSLSLLWNSLAICLLKTSWVLFFLYISVLVYIILLLFTQLHFFKNSVLRPVKGSQNNWGGGTEISLPRHLYSFPRYQHASVILVHLVYLINLHWNIVIIQTCS